MNEMINENEMICEREMEMPADWKSDVIYQRDGKGRMIEVEVPDDTERDDEIVGND